MLARYRLRGVGGGGGGLTCHHAFTRTRSTRPANVLNADIVGTSRLVASSLHTIAPSSGKLSSPIRARTRSHSSNAPLHQSPTVRAEPVELRQGMSGSQNGHDFSFHQTRRFARPGARLPTPLPPEVMGQRAMALRKRMTVRSQLRESNANQSDHSSTPMAFGDFTMATLDAINADESIYTPSHVKESVALLRACLSTGVIHRASKIFNDLRSSATPSSSTEAFKGVVPVGLDIYNAMLGAYMRKAWQYEDSPQSQHWVNTAWQLFDNMNGKLSGSDTRLRVDQRPDATTYAVFAKGLVRLMRANQYSRGQRDLGSLLASMRQNSIHAKDVILSPAFTQEHAELQNITTATFSRDGEPDARIVLQQMISAATNLADTALSTELHEVHRMLSHLERQADADVQQQNIEGNNPQASVLPELIPVRNTAKPKTMLKRQLDREQDDIAFNLSVLRENLSVVQQAKSRSTDPYERQKWLELGALDAARKRFDHAVANMEQIGLQNAPKMGTKRIQTWMWEWYGKLEKALTEELEKLRRDIEGPSAQIPRSPNSTILQSIYPFLRLVSPQKMALITVLEMVRLQNSGGVMKGMKTASALVNVGKKIESEAHAAHIQDKDAHFSSARSLQEELRKAGLSDYDARSRLRILLKRQQSASGLPPELSSWSFNLRARVGSFLVQNLMKVAKVRRTAVDRDGVEWSEEQPVFYSAYQYIQGRRLGVIRTNDMVNDQLASEGVPTDALQLRHLPMLVPPKPWVTHESGGYYSLKTRALRYKEAVEQGTYMRHACDNGQLNHVLAGLDALGQTAWTINDDVLAVVTKVWNSGKGLADLPPIEFNETEPEKPADHDTNIRSRAAYIKRLRSHVLLKAANHSQRCDANYKLEVARAYSGEKFYFPHNLDFRGRAYPIPPTLNHIGNDLCRGLLKFAEAKPLGASGLRWLRIHLANVYGFDKASFSEREQFSIDHIESIKASARDPLAKDGDWWLRADDPWQCLAACVELSRALAHPQGAEQYESNLPVHQDGTANGLQHISCLGGDVAGAKQVNLSNGDRPSDVYTGVSDLVNKVVDEDAERGRRVAQRLQGKITRKVVKQTVMTTVYGVTFIGAKEQVTRQLAARGDIPADELWETGTYLARVVIECIGDLFKGADAIKRWLTTSAVLIAKSIPSERVKHLSTNSKTLTAKDLSREQMTSVIWTTPLGLPVVQPYRKVKRKQVSTTMQTVFLHDPQTSTQVAPAKQASAFPPNYIHSLDATHMFLTALECQTAGLTFASVHDSYWTHACDVTKMNDVLRDTFIQLHSRELLKSLRDEFLSRFEGHVVPVAEARRLLRQRQKKEDAESKTAEALSADDTEALAEEEGDSSSDFDATLRKLDEHDQFVPLADVLPPIPKRGSFDVEETRGSLYFFS